MQPEIWSSRSIDLELWNACGERASRRRWWSRSYQLTKNENVATATTPSGGDHEPSASGESGANVTTIANSVPVIVQNRFSNCGARAARGAARRAT